MSRGADPGAVTPARLRVLVADDEAVARRRLLRLLEAMPDVEVAGECADGREVLALVGGGGVDLVLLDVEMPGLKGTEALQLFPPDGPIVVFCTAHAEHAIAAFDAGAVDYVLKPIDAARLRRAVDRARGVEAQRRFRDEVLRQRDAAVEPGAPARLALDTRDGIVLVDPDKIDYALVEGELVTVRAGDAVYFCDLALGELARRLPAFVRVHRRALVNLDHVVRLEPTPTGGFVARTARGDGIEVSRQAARDLRRRLKLG